MNEPATAQSFGPWCPGITSDLPREYLPLATIYRPENVKTTISEAHELRDFCGLASHELVAFRPERLIIHELLIRVAGDLAVYEGRKYEDLGINSRRMTSTILKNYISPHNAELVAVFREHQKQARQKLAAELEAKRWQSKSPVAQQVAPSFIMRLLRRRLPSPIPDTPTAPGSDQLQGWLESWQSTSRMSTDNFERTCLEALGRVVRGIAGRHGRLVGGESLIVELAATLVDNIHGSYVLGQAIEPHFRAGVQAEGYHVLPRQADPVVMNVKGASAAGKSTLRPLQHKLADRIGVNWDDFAVISPDIWRKFLLDYSTIGPAFKYAGMLAGHELEVVDRKLDRYMAEKAAKGDMTHLLIDRFRFDSFVPEVNADEPVRLLTRFGNLVYLFFMITPPESTVERAWRRGLMVGRYKSVDDLLGHNIEAFSGMPDLFFTWALRTDKRVHFEFLDNSVQLGNVPNTVAFGWNGEMNILDVAGMLNVDRFRKVNVRAKSPEEVCEGYSMAPEDNTAFLKRCARMLPVINFADRFTGRIYARIEGGHWAWRDPPMLAGALRDHQVRVGLTALGLPEDIHWPKGAKRVDKLDEAASQTLGAWGAAALSPAAGSFGH
ncbi:MAG: hypothetical protein ACR2PG_12650 [Hyphomicrobiaceae bacterium]